MKLKRAGRSSALALIIQERIPLVEDILTPFDNGEADLKGYKNHVYRLINFAFALDARLADEGRTKVVIAGCFHDLGLFTDNTLDYLPPSILRAVSYLDRNGQESWRDEITTMIDQHHKVRQLEGDDKGLAELFRRADLVDFSLGVFRFGLPRSQVAAIKRTFPNSGFHKHLLRMGTRWICRHPLNPVPVLKW